MKKWMLGAAAALALGLFTLPTVLRSGSDPADGATCKAEGQANLDFTLKDMNGADFKLAEQKGKVVLLNFWATWCAPCLREIPMLKQLQTTRPDLQVVGVAIDKRDPVIEFAGNIQFNYPILIGQSEAWAAAAALGVNIYALPFTIFTAADGSILGVHTGELHSEHLEEFSTIVDDLAAGRIDIEQARSRIAGRI
jgi:thiol-disulfide isomerase/thioredoxin